MIIAWVLKWLAVLSVMTVTPVAPTPTIGTAIIQPAPCSYAIPMVVANPELQDATARAIDRLTDVLGCVPFISGTGGIAVQFYPDFFAPGADPSGFDWVWVPAAWPFAPELSGVVINPRCWERVSGDWSIVIAHELGHQLGWLEMDGHPYMTCPLVSGEWYRADLVVVCGP